MKKIFALLMTVCLLVGALCVAAFAAEAPQDAPAPDTVMRVSALKNDDTTVKINDYTNFEIGWNAAIDTALANSYKRVIVDFYANWNAAGSVFGSDSGNGFDNETIYIPEGVNITINLNEHTIDRALNEWIYDGEVMYIEDDSDVIINNGTIKGGWSANGAGGIHVKDDVTLTLNNVNIVGNTADDADGGGISLESDSVLTMNGGRFENNLLIGASKGDCGGALYMDGGTAILNGVTFKNNLTQYDSNEGSAIYVTGGELTLNECTFEGNSLQLQSTTPYQSSVIYAKNSTVSVNESTFGNHHIDDILQISSSVLSMESCVFTGAVNTDDFIDIKTESSVYVTDTIFTDSSARVIAGTVARDSFFRNCTFNNTADDGQTFAISGDPLEFYDCNFGDTKHDSEYINLVLSTVDKEDALIGVSGVLKDGTTAFTSCYDNLVYGWNTAITLAMSNVYDRIIVDLYADWKANDEGEFCSDGRGFDNGTIYFPENVRVTLNMNGHTINRNLGESKSNGEVIYISENADVIINDGTIKGGKSNNGAGGIHINDGAYVTLNNVHITDNVADIDDGGGIAIYDGATLIMNGGSFKNNVIVGSWSGTHQCYGGAIYVEDSKATFENVEFRNNQTEYDEDYGAAIYADDSEVYVKNCTFDGNGIKDDAKNFKTSCSIIHGDDSTINIEKSTFTNNGGGYHYDPRYAMTYTMDEYIGFYSSVFTLEDTKLYISGDSKISNNNVYYIVFARGGSSVYATDTTITDNTAMVMWSSAANENDNYFKNCTLNNNKLTSDKIQIAGGHSSSGIYADYHGESFYIDVYENFKAIRIHFENCDMGDSKFEEWAVDYVKFVNCKNAPKNNPYGGSIFGEGSLAMIFALLALVASGVSIFLVVYYNKKKAVPVTADNAEETVEEE